MRTIVLSIVLAALSGDTLADQPPAFSALLETLSGRVFLLDSADAPPRPLSPEVDKYRVLFGGQVVRCEAGGTAELRFGTRLQKLVGPVEFRVPTPKKEEQSEGLKALEEFFRSGSRSRANPSGLIAPAAEGAVRGEKLTIRWEAPDWRGPLLITIADETGMELWQRGGVNPADGTCEDVELRRKLSQAREPTNGRSLLLTLTTASGQVVRSNFELLSLEEENAVTQELIAWNREAAGSIPRHIGRAGVFLRHRLLNEAAAEADAAIMLAPKSRALLEGAAEIHRRIGALARAEALLRAAAGP